tara:strand:+ start:77360 stop:77566 length:207 start_codon:yes stop_codon:yes gene_type:complete
MPEKRHIWLVFQMMIGLYGLAFGEWCGNLSPKAVLVGLGVNQLHDWYKIRIFRTCLDFMDYKLGKTFL